MPGIARLGNDLNSGHILIDATPCVAGSPTVFCNGVPVARVGDPWAPHVLHVPLSLTGSTTVFANGLGVTRIGDLTDCGTTIITGSIDTMCGG